MVDSYYMVPVVDGDDKVRSVKAMGVSRITTLEATGMPADIEKRFPRSEATERGWRGQRGTWSY